MTIKTIRWFSVVATLLFGTLFALPALGQQTSFYLSITVIGPGVVTSSPDGKNCLSFCVTAYPSGSVISLAATPGPGHVFSGWTEDCAGLGSCLLTMDGRKSVRAAFDPAGSGSFSLDATSVDFGGQSMKTTSPARLIKLSNTGTSPVTVTSISASPNFSSAHNCSTLGAGASCAASITFTPTTEGALSGTLAIHTNVGQKTVALSGVGERSMVTHYYRSILRRAPDLSGKTFWETEAARVTAMGASVNEAWYAMAMSFFFSAEYVSFNRNPTEFVRDLYNAFYNREADASGLSFWTGQIAAGMPREVVLTSFMFSQEFRTFTQEIFGNTTARTEVDTAVDFYRALLSRLPDNGGFNYWLQSFRTAQCQGSSSVYSQVDAISGAFVNGTEYLARGRTNAQYVSDLYNGFLRRGGDLAGVLFWINQLDSGARSREHLRRDFLASPEFNSRVGAIIAQGCLEALPQLNISLSVQQVKPFFPFVVTVASTNPAATYEVRYDLGAGYVVSAQTEPGSSGKIQVSAPPGIINSASGFAAGVVKVMVKQTLNGQSTTSNSVDLRVLDLPVSPYLLGVPTKTLIQASRLMALDSVGNLGLIASRSSSTLDVSGPVSAANKLIASLNKSVTNIDTARSGQLSLGTIGGRQIFIDASSASMLDRMSMGIIESLAASSSAQAADDTWPTVALPMPKDVDLFQDPAALARMMAESARTSAKNVGKGASIVLGVITVGALIAGAPEIALAAAAMGAVAFMTTTLAGTGISAMLDGGSAAIVNGSATLEDFKETGKFFGSQYLDLAKDKLLGLYAQGIGLGPVGQEIVGLGSSALDAYETFTTSKVVPAFQSGALPAAGIPASPFVLTVQATAHPYMIRATTVPAVSNVTIRVQVSGTDGYVFTRDSVAQGGIVTFSPSEASSGSGIVDTINVFHLNGKAQASTQVTF